MAKNVQDGDETDIDCGGRCGGTCTGSQSCRVPQDCVGTCFSTAVATTCVSCFNGA
eukprot:SAG11_NODE_5260_length_1613_cov_1.500661_2_plen_55_part_01